MKDFSKTLRTVFLGLLPLYIGKTGDKIVNTLKQDGTPVGDLDNLAMTALRACIKDHFPDDFTIGEEDERDDAEMQRILARTDEFQWTIDGLDGTGNRRMGTTYGAMVSRRRGDRILYSAFFLPINQAVYGDGFFDAEYGAGAWQWQGTPGIDERPEQSQLLTAKHGTLERHTIFLEGSSKKFATDPRIAKLCRIVTTRPSASSSVAATIIASGKGSSLVMVDNEPWDAWPAIRLIEEAGGTVTDWDGEPVTPANCRNIIASGNETDHDCFLEILRP